MFRRNLAWSGALALTLFTALASTQAFSADATLQAAVKHAMSSHRGTAVVLDVRSGEIVAASHLDVAARRLVAPGSSIKPFTLLALLQSGKVNEQTALMCKRPLSIAGHKLDCSHPPTTQPLAPAVALAYSCNSYFTTVVLRLSGTDLRNAFVADGFSSATAMTSEEAAGEVTLAHSPEQLQLQAVGEWGIRVTPLELLRGYRSLALLQAKHEHKLEPLFVGLRDSATYGMGRLAQPPILLKVAGKTGTAPADEGAWTHAWFAGYAPADNPKMVLVIFLEHGHGGSDAAGVAREIFAAYGESASQVAQQVKGTQR
jgi:penicillin-binding protein 2